MNLGEFKPKVGLNQKVSGFEQNKCLGCYNVTVQSTFCLRLLSRCLIQDLPCQKFVLTPNFLLKYRKNIETGKETKDKTFCLKTLYA